jgi:histidinol-phosphatase
MSETATLLSAVEEVARAAGREALRHFRGSLAVHRKSDGSPVTAADRGAEQVARDWIANRFPTDGILGEEFGAHNTGAARRWLVDPIDGTASFVRGVPLWGTLIAVAQGEEILAGAIFCPAVDELVCAAKGEGSWWNGSRARVSTTDDLARALVLTTDARFAATPDRLPILHAIVARAAESRGWGDCFGYLLVATGRADVMIDPKMSPWDAAALLPVIEEAGGAFTDWKGHATAFGGDGVATNAALARPVRGLIAAGP